MDQRIIKRAWDLEMAYEVGAVLQGSNNVGSNLEVGKDTRARSVLWSSGIIQSHGLPGGDGETWI